MIDTPRHNPAILPPNGLLLALAAQLPLILMNLPLQPSMLEVSAGLALLTAGAVLNIWAERLFRRSRTGVCPFSAVRVLVLRGPYRLTRNPMYLGLVCLTLGVALATGVSANAWSSIAYAIWLHYVLPEEGFLRHELGRRFDDYVSRVPRWLPLGSLAGGSNARQSSAASGSEL